MEIKDIVTKELLIKETLANIALTNSVKRRRQVSRLKELIIDNQPLTSDDSDVVKAVYTILNKMTTLRMIRYGATAYVEWDGYAPDDMISLGVDDSTIYNFTNLKLKDPIQMYNDIDEKAEGAAKSLLEFIFSVASGINLRDRLNSLENMDLEHINLSDKEATDIEVATIEEFANFVDDQNGKGAFAASLMYPILNDDYGKKRKHAVFGYGSNTGKGLLLAIINKLYVGAPIQMPVRPNERDVYSTGAWNKQILNKWIVILGDSSESDITYDFMKNLYEQPLSIAGRNERTKEQFYGNVYIATNSQQEFFSDKEIYTRVFFVAMFQDVDKVLGEDKVKILDSIHRDSVVKYLIKHQDEARTYWKNYETSPLFYQDEAPEKLYEEFLTKYKGTAVPVRTIKTWINNPKKYKKLMDLIKDYHGPSTTVKIDGVSTRAIDLRTFILPDISTLTKEKATSDNNEPRLFADSTENK